MNDEPFEIGMEAARHQAAQALFLARVLASVAAVAATAGGQIGTWFVRKSQMMLAEIGGDAVPFLASVVFRFQPIFQAGLPVLAIATLFFIWSRGQVAAWMAGIGLLVLILALPVTIWAAFLPLIQIINEMGSM